MASHYERLIRVISRHTDTSASTRVPPDVADAAKELLKERRWTVFDFLRACLITLVEKPDEMLAYVQANRAPKAKGRPRKTAREALAAGEGKPETRASRAMRAKPAE